ncbi:MAG: exonuclease [Oscillatoriales cyanobacterium RM2_1_1]|nr:exonuclease [Oscillatoriales cyanobacterium SM2_3_0]NJO47674.1 exonuclease [Oscillatoriales cyanobacterium RM2_1_1]
MVSHSNFIVIDTVGQSILQELAIVDDQGNLIYEAWTESPSQYPHPSVQAKPLEIIIQDFIGLAQDKTIICHYARQDIEVLRNTFRIMGIDKPPLKFECSFELAKRYLPQFDRDALAGLNQQLRLKQGTESLETNQVHRAKYEALFTFQLYKRMINELLRARLKQQPNPFSSSRVDTPFQDHIDFRAIFQHEFERLKSCLIDIKQDRNHQSKGAVVIGEPGSGKTHLMMRLAKDLLKTNRLLFVRQPNNPDTVLFHTYSRILESLIQTVPGSDRTQLEHLLANSFAEIIKNTDAYATPIIQKDDRILSIIQADHLKLFTELGQEDTKVKREYWQHIEKRVYDWWLQNFSAAGYAPKILRGIVKFCGYTDFNRRQIITQWLSLNDLAQDDLDKVALDSWGEAVSREEISLTALEVLSKLSLLDEPLIIIFDQLEGLGLAQNESLLRKFGEGIKEIFTHVPNSLIILNLFPDRWEQFQQLFDGSIVDRVSQSQIFLNKPDDQALRKLLDLKIQPASVGLEELFDPAEIQAILQQNSIRSTLNVAADYYRLKIDGIALPRRFSSGSIPEKPALTVERQLHQLVQDVAQIKQVIDQITQHLDWVKPESTETGAVPSPLSVAESLTVSSLESPDHQLNHSIQDDLQKYLQQQQNQLTVNYHNPQVITESDDLGKLTAILNALSLIVSPLSFDSLKLGKKVVPEHLRVKTITHQFVVAFLHQSGSRFFYRLRNLNELMEKHPEIQFNLCRDIKAGPVQGKKSEALLDQFQSSLNGQFIVLDRQQRITFEIVYQLIVDIQNRDLELDLTKALNLLLMIYRDYWLFQNLTLLTLDL